MALTSNSSRQYCTQANRDAYPTCEVSTQKSSPENQAVSHGPVIELHHANQAHGCLRCFSATSILVQHAYWRSCYHVVDSRRGPATMHLMIVMQQRLGSKMISSLIRTRLRHSCHKLQKSRILQSISFPCGLRPFFMESFVKIMGYDVAQVMRVGRTCAKSNACFAFASDIIGGSFIMSAPWPRARFELRPPRSSAPHLIGSATC